MAARKPKLKVTVATYHGDHDAVVKALQAHAFKVQGPGGSPGREEKARLTDAYRSDKYGKPDSTGAWHDGYIGGSSAEDRGLAQGGSYWRGSSANAAPRSTKPGTKFHGRKPLPANRHYA